MTNKTKNRILQAARLLFNEEGETNVAMVDIAAVLDISPGNLYYHYRGKEQLIPVLFGLFEQELSSLLTADIEALVSLDDRWVFVYLILDKIYQYRFLHTLDAIRFDKSLHKRRQRLDALLIKRLIGLIQQLRSDANQSEPNYVGHYGADNEELKILAENISLFMFAWIEYSESDMGEQQILAFLHQGAYRVFYQVAVIVNHRETFLASCLELQRRSTG